MSDKDFSIKISATENASSVIDRTAQGMEDLSDAAQDSGEQMDQHSEATEKAEEGLQMMEDAAKDMADALEKLQKEEQAAAQEMGNVGEQAEQSAEQVDRASESAARSSERIGDAAANARLSALQASSGLVELAKDAKDATEGIFQITSAMARFTQGAMIFMAVFKGTEWLLNFTLGLDSAAEKEEKLRNQIEATNAALAARQEYLDYNTSRMDKAIQAQTQRAVEESKALGPAPVAEDAGKALSNLQGQQNTSKSTLAAQLSIREEALKAWQAAMQDIEKAPDDNTRKLAEQQTHYQKSKVEAQDRRIANLEARLEAMRPEIEAAQQKYKSATESGYRRATPMETIDQMINPVDVPNSGTQDAEDALRQYREAAEALKTAAARRAATDAEIAEQLQDAAQIGESNTERLTTAIYQIADSTKSQGNQIATLERYLNSLEQRVLAMRS